jgi:tetraacyldisaccharide 4'-kinase
LKNSGFKLYYIWKPVSLLYEAGVRLRNQLFTWEWLTSEQYQIPVICVGNLAVGGTGKTPVIEYLVRLLHAEYRVAVLSRGYKRKSEGFVLAQEKSTADDIGDEPYQIKLKFPGITVAVDSDRRRGMKQLLSLPEDQRPQVVLLDDGFQHRYVQPSLSIIITDYNRLYYKDKLMPVGRLREPASSIRRADMVIVSKCNESLQQADAQIVEGGMNLRHSQPSFFTSIAYQQMKGVYPEKTFPRTFQSIKKDDKVLLIAGIANPALFIKEVQKYSDHVHVLSFPDHHDFTPKDIQKIRDELQQMKAENPFMICTEKDAVRIRNKSFFPEEWKPYIYYIPLMIHFLFERGERFDELIRKHIETIINNNILEK